MDNNINNGQMQMPTMSPTLIKAIKDSPVVKCDCGSVAFTSAAVFKKVPGVYIGSTEPVLYPIPVYVCTECGKIMKDMVKDGALDDILNEHTDSTQSSQANDEQKKIIID